MVEYQPQFEDVYKILRPNCIHKISDAREVDYRKILDDNNFPENIDINKDSKGGTGEKKEKQIE